MTLSRFLHALSWAGLFGYAMMSSSSIAFSQISLGIGLSSFLIFLILPRGQKFVAPPWKIMSLIAGYVAMRIISSLAAGTNVLEIHEDWLFLMVLFGALMFQEVRYTQIMLDFFTAGLLFIGAYGIWQHFYGVDLVRSVLLGKMEFGYRIIGTFSTPLTFSGFFTLSSVFLMAVSIYAHNKWRKGIYIVASQVALVCVMFSYTRSTLAAIIAGVIILLVLVGPRRRRNLALILLVVVSAAVIIAPDFSARMKDVPTSEFTIKLPNSRLAIWRTALDIFVHNPLLGVGPGNFHEGYIKYRELRYGHNYSHAHNDILNVAAETGVIGLAFFLILWGSVLYYLYWGYKRCPEGFQKGLILGALLASIAYLVMAQFEAFFADEEVRLLLMFFWGIGLAVVGNMKASEKLTEIA
jgi:putative inorganic carbon (HCO3(-)) transporter